jgi:tRNA isopentenyl-2-thiomethyl-A-37 hydroxylase MiaE
VCGVCDSEVSIFYHKVVNSIRLHLLQEYSKLQEEYFEEDLKTKCWNDYITKYRNYEVKFRNCMEGLLACDAYTEGRVCIDYVLEAIYFSGCLKIFPITLLESLMLKEKSIDEVSEELDDFIGCDFFEES